MGDGDVEDRNVDSELKCKRKVSSQFLNVKVGFQKLTAKNNNLRVFWIKNSSEVYFSTKAKVNAINNRCGNYIWRQKSQFSTLVMKIIPWPEARASKEHAGKMPEKVSLPARSQPKSSRQEASHALRSKRTPRCAPVLGGSLGKGVWRGKRLTETSHLSSVTAEHKQAWGPRGYEDLRQVLPCPGAPGRC